MSCRQIVVMGVAGSGKTTVGRLLARTCGLPYRDGDDLHPRSNIDKMIQGIPLNDEDRKPWLDLVGNWLAENPTGGVISCSALKRSYRDQIRTFAPEAVFVHLNGDYDTLLERMKNRACHFMPACLLDSQFDILEELGNDETGKVFDITDTPAEIVQQVEAWVKSL